MSLTRLPAINAIKSESERSEESEFTDSFSSDLPCDKQCISEINIAKVREFEDQFDIFSSYKSSDSSC